MGDLFLQCQFGQRRKDGKVVRPATCQNRASGIFRVIYVRGKPKVLLLCAQCSFDKMPNHVCCPPPPDDAPKGTQPTYFRDVFSVQLLATLGTKFVQGHSPNIPGYKHWVERKQLPEKSGVVKLKIVESRTKHMDMSAYLETLRNHSDGK